MSGGNARLSSWWFRGRKVVIERLSHSSADLFIVCWDWSPRKRVAVLKIAIEAMPGRVVKTKSQGFEEQGCHRPCCITGIQGTVADGEIAASLT